MFEVLLNQSLLNLVGYGLVTMATVRAIWHWRQLRHKRAQFDADAIRVAQWLIAGRYRNMFPSDCEHPATKTVARLLEQGEGTEEQVQRWGRFELDNIIEPLAAAREANRDQATFFGFLGTLAGFLAGAQAFSAHGSVALTLQAIALAMITTMVGGIAAQIEAFNLRQMGEVARHLRFETTDLISRLIRA